MSQLIEGQSCALSCCYSVSSLCGEFESTDSESLREVEKSGIVGDCSYDCDDSVIKLCFSGWYGCAVLGEVLGDA